MFRKAVKWGLNLLEAHPIYLAAKDRGPAHKDTLACVQALVDLYAAWDKADPGKGYDSKAAEWKTRLEPPKAMPTSGDPAGSSGQEQK